MQVVRFVHWHEKEAPERARPMVEAGYEVDHRPPKGIGDIVPRDGRQPDAIVIDLSRQPANGRYLAIELRRSRRCRAIPLVLVDGAPEKVARLRSELPDAVYTPWEALPTAIAGAIASSSDIEPSTPLPSLWGHRSLAQKLCVAAGCRVSLIGAPDGFEELLGDLPEGTTIRHGASPRADVTIWFVETSAELEGRIVGFAELAETGKLWIAWPKKNSGILSDLSMQVVRDAADAVDLSDYKIVSIDKVWSAMIFGRRGGRRR